MARTSHGPSGENKGTDMTTEHDTRAGHPDRRAAVIAFRRQLTDMTWVSLRVHTRVLQAFGLTTFQALALKALSDCADPLDMARLADITAVPPSTLTTVIDRLERDGFAERRSHPKDRRKVLVVVTDAGNDLLQQAEAAGLRLTTEMLRSVSDHDLQVVTQVARQMTQAIENLDDNPELVRQLIEAEG